MRRGDIRPLLLVALLDGPAHGYEVIRRLEERSGSRWRPSAGSVYPTLQLLEEEGLLDGHKEAGKRVFTLTEDGRAAAEEAARRSPWDRLDAEDEGCRGELRLAMEQVNMAATQVAMAGTDSQMTEAVEALKELRQRLYRILADG